MLKRVVERFSSSLGPWEVFRNLYTVQDVCFFLDSVTHRYPDQNYSYIAANPFFEFSLKAGTSASKPVIEMRGAKPAGVLRENWMGTLRACLKKFETVKSKPLPFFSGGAVGYWSYDLVPFLETKIRNFKAKSELPPLYFGFFRDVIVYDHRARSYWLVTHEGPGQPKARESFNELKRFFYKPKAFKAGLKITGFKPDIPRSRFEKMVRRAKGYIESGDIYQANLSQRFSFHCEGDKLRLYDALRRINPSPFASFFKIRDLEIISSSPERLVAKRGDLCETRPIAGTRRKPEKGGLAKVKSELLGNEKERAEHIMLVDLERNDLGRVCKWPSVRVDEMMKIEAYSHVVHIVSKITGRLEKGRDALDLMGAMFPGGTVTGCPKIRCMEIIDELEPSARGLYTGSIGYLDFSGDMDMNIVIRTLVLNGKKGHLQVGAGIVYDSDPAREYEETLHKGEALAEALARSAAVK